MNLNFRLLNADEIECRIAMIKENGLSLLLYKDARVDQNILDETVGAMNWQRFHSRDNANCTVQIWDSEKKQWIGKEDTGTESNTEKEKGLASDSFKRACFNWGIGRELYTAPFIWVPASSCTIKDRKCYDRFKVASIAYDGRVISELSIINTKTRKEVFHWDGSNEKAARESTLADPGNEGKWETLIETCKKYKERTGKVPAIIKGKTKPEDITVVMYIAAMDEMGTK